MREEELAKDLGGNGVRGCMGAWQVMQSANTSHTSQGTMVIPATGTVDAGAPTGLGVQDPPSTPVNPASSSMPKMYQAGAPAAVGFLFDSTMEAFHKNDHVDADTPSSVKHPKAAYALPAPVVSRAVLDFLPQYASHPPPMAAIKNNIGHTTAKVVPDGALGVRGKLAFRGGCLSLEPAAIRPAASPSKPTNRAANVAIPSTSARVSPMVFY